MRRTTISLPDDLAMVVEEEAKRLQMSVSEVIRLSIRETLVGAAKRPLPFSRICDDPKMTSGADMEEALAEGWARDIARGHR